MRIASVILLASVLGLPLGAAAQEQGSASGQATVIDGSTLKVDGVVYRFVAVMAPGLHQTCTRNGVSWPCGEEAARLLAKIIKGRSVRCSEVGQEGDHQPLAVCYAGETELNRAMVDTGMAVVHWQLGLDYTEAEAIAKAAHAGLWSGTFADPWKWREEHSTASQKPVP
jgi:endonuclease YncB( thermonuclease family)